MKKLALFFLPLLIITSCEKFDDSSLWDAINENKSSIQALQTQVNNLNRRADELKSLIDAVDKKESIKEISELSDGTGYTILFTSGRSIVIHHGNDGKDGSTPVISVKQDTDGVWYWTLNGTWMLNEKGDKIAATAKDGTTPLLKIENNYWYVSIDNGATWTKLEKATGDNGNDGDAFFKEVRQDDDNAFFVLVDGTVITLPLSSATRFNIVFDSDTVPILDAGEAKTIHYTITKATDNTIVKTIAQNGWVATVNQMSKDAGDIFVRSPNPIVDSEILVFASDGDGHTVMAVLDCVKGLCTVTNNSYSVNSDSGHIDLVVTTNMPYDIIIPTEAQSWISLKPETKAAITETKTLFIEKNTDFQKRYSTIKLIDTNNITLQTIEIVQDAASFDSDLSITVTSAGTLSSALSSYAFTTLKSLSISGPLDDDDYTFIKNELISLRKLNLSGATGVEPIFKNHKYTLDLIILPSCQTSISEGAFSGSYLVRVILPEKLQSIGASAFYNCSRMTGDVYIPKTVSYIGGSAFDGTKIQSFTIADNIQLPSINNNSLPPTISALRIPASVTTLYSSAFSNLTSLKHLSFEDGSVITEIPSACFAKLPLETVLLPASLERIGGQMEPGDYGSYTNSLFCGGAFEGCTSLTSIIIPRNVRVIEAAAFHSSGLKSVVFEDNCQLEKVCGWTYRYLRGCDRIGAFSSTPIEVLSIPASVTEIQDAAFANCTKMQDLSFAVNSSLKSIGGSASSGFVSGAFYNCGIQQLTIPASVEEISCGAFDSCKGLVSLTLENGSHLSKLSGVVGTTSSDTKYSFGSFSNCTGLKEITIPASVTSVESGAFYGCTSLAMIQFEQGSQCVTIGNSTQSGPFEGSPAQSLSIPKSTTKVICLGGMNALESLIIEEGAEVLFSSSSCKGLMNIRLIDASKASFSAGAQAFYNSPCSVVKLGSIRPPSCADSAFPPTCPRTLYVPAESISDYKQEVGWKNFTSIKSL